MNKWTMEEGVELATAIEAIAPRCGAHIGLTGGLLYKKGPRKDLDIVVYRIRQRESIDLEQFFTLLHAIGIVATAYYGFVVKAQYKDGRVIDFLFPEHKDGEYQQ